jgi:pilus assembly protein Flp/PilA
MDIWFGRDNAMKPILNSLKNFLVSEDGPAAVEYAVMLALIIVVCISAVTTIGTKANAKFQSAASHL